MQRALADSKGSVFGSIMLLIKGQGEYSQGKVKSARQTFAQAVSSASQHDLKELVAGLRATESSWEAALGNMPLARQGASAALAQSDDMESRAQTATALALTGDTSGAQKVVDGLAREFPKNTLLNDAYLPLPRALNYLQRNEPEKAIAALEVAKPYEFGSAPAGIDYWPAYLRGLALLGLKDGVKAAGEYQKILDRRGVNPTSPLYTLSRLGLARAYVIQGDTSRARTAYQDFFAAWKDADPDVPVLIQAKAEYAKLK
jgi:hypothetical protein